MTWLAIRGVSDNCFISSVFLWQTLFATQDHGGSQIQAETAHSDQQGGEKNALGSGATPSHSNPTEEAIANYTKWLALFTLFLVLATFALFLSGERNVEVASRSAAAVIKAVNSLSTVERAYIFLNYEIESTYVNKKFREGHGPAIYYTFRNSGKTPGTFQNISANIRHFESGTPINFEAHEAPDAPPSESYSRLTEKDRTSNSLLRWKSRTSR